MGVLEVIDRIDKQEKKNKTQSSQVNFEVLKTSTSDSTHTCNKNKLVALKMHRSIILHL